MSDQHLPLFEHVFDVTVLLQGRADRNALKELLQVRVGIALLDETVEGRKIKPKIQIVDEGFFFVADIDESCI